MRILVFGASYECGRITGPGGGDQCLSTALLDSSLWGSEGWVSAIPLVSFFPEASMSDLDSKPYHHIYSI